VLHEVITGLGAAGLPVRQVMPSHLRGADGNIEFFVHCRREPVALPAAAVDTAVLEAHGGDG
jgi:23S rRNA (cytidine1920-2'-O)/16S rRNA (cytidine1409-2'-O)-methyltransferase